MKTESMPDLIPDITQGQLEVLDAMFPNACPNPRWDDRRIWMEAGARMVVEKMLDHHRRYLEE